MLSTTVSVAVAVVAGAIMILLRYITVAKRTDDICAKVLNIISAIIGSLSIVCLSLVANFREGQLHGVGHVHETGAGIVFTGGCVFLVTDAIVTLWTQLMDIRDADAQRHWRRSVRWFEWIRPFIALLSAIAWLLCILCHYS